MNPTDGHMTEIELRQRYGQPRMISGGDPLRHLGLRRKIHPDDVGAFFYPSQEAADAFAAANLEQFGYADLGSWVTEGGVTGVLDLRQALPQPTDPAIPDTVYGSVGHL